jgi:hypothetical protein
VTDNDVTDNGISALARSAKLTVLKRLGVARNEEVTAEGLRALATSRKLKRLRWVEFSDEDGMQQIVVRGGPS